jgi:hypothetical protein
VLCTSLGAKTALRFGLQDRNTAFKTAESTRQSIGGNQQQKTYNETLTHNCQNDQQEQQATPQRLITNWRAWLHRNTSIQWPTPQNH